MDGAQQYRTCAAKGVRRREFQLSGSVFKRHQGTAPRWKRCVQAADNNLGESLGMQFVKTNFTPKARERMNEMIDNLFAAMKVHIDNLKWMGPETKQKAQLKLAAYKRKIGYPDKLRGYKGLAINRKTYLANLLRSASFRVGRDIADIGKPADKTRFNWSPPTVNASYSAANNDITFPAGILQPPFFNFNADDAINYGGIGGVIGHEITHGFDDQGSKFGADGNLNMWWTKKDREEFEKRASCVADQFSGYEVQPGLNINGRLTLGENIGDFGGLTIAYDAFMRSLEGKPRPADIDGFTPEQRFFLGWAQVWAAKATPEFERRQVLTDPHSAAKWRVNGPLSNMPEFSRAFGCKTGNPMVRKKFCEIW
jgi:predicted metalloendopeptidase